MNTSFVNKYIYTEDIIKESIGVWWNKKYKFNNITLILLIILSVIELIFTKDIKWVILLVIAILTILLFIYKRQKAIKINLERAKVMYDDEKVNVEVIVGENIQLKTKDVKREIALNKIEKYVVTENLVVLFVKSEMTIPIVKNGFEQGTYNEFIEFLKNRINS